MSNGPKLFENAQNANDQSLDLEPLSSEQDSDDINTEPADFFLASPDPDVEHEAAHKSMSEEEYLDRRRLTEAYLKDLQDKMDQIVIRMNSVLNAVRSGELSTADARGLIDDIDNEGMVMRFRIDRQRSINKRDDDALRVLRLRRHLREYEDQLRFTKKAINEYKSRLGGDESSDADAKEMLNRFESGKVQLMASIESAKDKLKKAEAENTPTSE